MCKSECVCGCALACADTWASAQMHENQRTSYFFRFVTRCPSGTFSPAMSTRERAGARVQAAALEGGRATGGELNGAAYIMPAASGHLSSCALRGCEAEICRRPALRLAFAEGGGRRKKVAEGGGRERRRFIAVAGARSQCGQRKLDDLPLVPRPVCGRRGGRACAPALAEQRTHRHGALARRRADSPARHSAARAAPARRSIVSGFIQAGFSPHEPRNIMAVPRAQAGA